MVANAILFLYRDFENECNKQCATLQKFNEWIKRCSARLAKFLMWGV